LKGKINQADSYSIVINTNPKAKRSAIDLYEEALRETDSLDKSSVSLPSIIREEIKNLKKTIAEKLENLEE